jgi:hypothetical protein
MSLLELGLGTLLELLLVVGLGTIAFALYRKLTGNDIAQWEKLG